MKVFVIGRVKIFRTTGPWHRHQDIHRLLAGPEAKAGVFWRIQTRLFGWKLASKVIRSVGEITLRYTWNPNDPCFDWKSPCFGGLTFKNRGHLGSRYVISRL